MLCAKYYKNMIKRLLCALGFHDLIVIPESIHEVGKNYPDKFSGVAKCSRCEYMQSAVATYRK
jgi:hypothetical protein